MLTTGFKLYMGLFVAAFASAVAFGYTTGGSHLGPLTVGYKGAVGDHVGYGILITISALFLALALLYVAFRDADARAAAQLLGTDTVPVQRPVGPSYWPIIGAFGAGMTALGLVLNAVVFVLGLLILAVVAIEWTMQAWADRATGDPEINRQLRDRIMQPIEVPVGAAIAIVAVPILASRIFLAVSKMGAVWAASAVAAVIFIAAVIIATRPRLSKNAVAGLVVFIGVALLAAGVVSAAVGQRDFEHHGSGSHSEEEGVNEEGTGGGQGTSTGASDAEGDTGEGS